MKNDILKQSMENAGWITEIRRKLHSMPETEFSTADTSAFAAKTLRKLGIEPKECGKSGITAAIGSGEPVFLLRADMDALPIEEETGLAYAAANGNMHACGHDMHAAMLLGAAKLLKERETELCGTVKLMFQSAEEIFEGAKDMIASGILEDPKPGAGMMIHVMSGVPMPTGNIIVCDGGVSAPGADFFTIRVQGKGCHGSMPHTGIDPITAGAHIVLGLQELQARELSLGDQAVLTIGCIQAGQAPNIIPDTLTLSGSLRTYDEALRSYIKDRIASIAGSIAQAYRASADVKWDRGCPVLQNDSTLSAQSVRWSRALLGENKVMTPSEIAAASGGKGMRSSGSEDFAYISQQIPTIMVSLAAGNPKDGYTYPLHHPKAAFDETALPVGAAVLANTAIRWLEENKKAD